MLFSLYTLRFFPFYFILHGLYYCSTTRVVCKRIKGNELRQQTTLVNAQTRFSFTPTSRFFMTYFPFPDFLQTGKMTRVCASGSKKWPPGLVWQCKQCLHRWLRGSMSVGPSRRNTLHLSHRGMLRSLLFQVSCSKVAGLVLNGYFWYCFHYWTFISEYRVLKKSNNFLSKILSESF